MGLFKHGWKQTEKGRGEDGGASRPAGPACSVQMVPEVPPGARLRLWAPVDTATESRAGPRLEGLPFPVLPERSLAVFLPRGAQMAGSTERGRPGGRSRTLEQGREGFPRARLRLSTAR